MNQERENQLLKENLNLDSQVQHMKHYLEGYREYVQSLRDPNSVDLDKYSPDSARRFSYDCGVKTAKGDLLQKGDKVEFMIDDQKYGGVVESIEDNKTISVRVFNGIMSNIPLTDINI